MTLPILLVLALFVVQTLMPATIRYLLTGASVGERLRVALGPRDTPPALGLVGSRAERALANLQEAMPVFLTIALLHAMRERPDPSAVRGALVFFAARVAYVPAYLTGVPGVRSALWTLSWVGLVMMIAALHVSG